MAEATWKSASFMQPSFVEKKIGDETLRFYTISVECALRLRSVAAPLAQALAVLFGNTDKTDIGIVSRKITSKSGDEQEEQIVEAIDHRLAQARFDQRSKTISDLVTNLTDDKSVDALYAIIIDSLRDVYPAGSANDAKLLREVRKDMPSTVFMPMLFGVAAANKEVLGPLGLNLSALVQGLSAKVNAAANQAAVPTGTDGPSSPTNLSSSSNE